MLLSTVTIITGCTPSLSSDTYTYGGVGQVNRVVPGVVVSSRMVQIADDANASDGGMTGTIGGGTAGLIAGSAIGGGRGSALAAVGGAVIGGIVGNMTQKELTKQQGIEYVVKLRSGSFISVVQGVDVVYRPGQRVLVQYGKRARIVADPGYIR